ncbi:hypothetical protein BZL29_3220 [Mycobacterium kansasii]|uniref:Uncharacterized protein n=1 Tax=Mycobacterium kansasii TaxID=1768 RepID=A0A1V3XEG0_MYCKA|nr:hypothetical protein BZL29_3220 [Mycobacterium kansasii]
MGAFGTDQMTRVPTGSAAPEDRAVVWETIHTDDELARRLRCP